MTMNIRILLAAFLISIVGAQPVMLYAQEAHQQQQPIIPARQAKTLEIQSNQELQTKAVSQAEPSTTKSVLWSIAKWVGITCAIIAGMGVIFFAGFGILLWLVFVGKI
ncbi:MAG TPA: hypothetical protein VLG71_03565 [Candidatus Limnocylindria bacterium]|nr:hypothetical protein [Candidatus Limnocylindria bacterium]